MMTQTNPKLPMKQNDDFLCHHGTKGQKWGVRRYQEKDGSLTPLGRIHWGIGPERKAAIKKKFTLAKDNVKKLALKAKTKHEENVKLRKEKQEQSIANKKAKLLGKGDPAEIHKNRALFSDAELDQAMNRIKKLQDLKSMDPKQKEAMQKLQQTQQNRQVVKDGRSTVNKIVSAGKAAVGIAGTAIAVYQSYNKIAGAINEISGKDQLPTFDLNPWSKKDTDKKKDDQGSDNKGTGDEKTKKYDLKTLGAGSTTNASIVKRGKDDYYTTSKDMDTWNDISFSPSSWSSSSTVGSTDSYGVSDVKQKRSSQKTQSLFDVNNGYLTSSDLKAVSKGKSDTARSASTLLSMYSGQEKAKDVTFDDLAAPDLWRAVSKETGHFYDSVKVKKSGDSTYTIAQPSVGGDYGFTSSDTQTIYFDKKGEPIFQLIKKGLFK